jgi:cobalt-precorrin 5A hydrolase
VDWRALDLPPGVLVLRPRVLGVGVGCRKGAAARDVLEAVDAALARCSAARGAVFALASLELKAGEPGLLEAARILEADTAFFSAEELRTFDPPTPSRAVRERVGVDSVCESAAMALCRTTRLLVQKTKTPRATAAVARCG